MLWVLLSIPFLNWAQNQELEKMFHYMEHLEKNRDQDSLAIMAPIFLAKATAFPDSDLYLWARHYDGAFRWKERPDTSLQILLEVHEAFKKRGIFLGTVKSALSLGIVSYYHVNDVSQSSEYYGYGIERLEKEGAAILGDSLNNSMLAWFYNSLSTNTSNQGDYESAMQLALKAKSKLEFITNDRQEALALMNLANINASLKEYEISQKYNQELLAVCRRMGDREFTSMALNNLAAGFGNMGKIDSALVYMEKAYELSKIDQNWKQLSLRASNIGFIFQKLDSLSEARKYFEEALTMARKNS